MFKKLTKTAMEQLSSSYLPIANIMLQLKILWLVRTKSKLSVRILLLSMYYTHCFYFLLVQPLLKRVTEQLPPHTKKKNYGVGASKGLTNYKQNTKACQHQHPIVHYTTNIHSENPSLFPTATFDIQQPRAMPTDGENIMVTGELIEKSRAMGCFLAIQCNSTTEVTFLALKRNGTNTTLFEKITMPPSNYTVYVHDLEENGLPNPLPANPNPDSVETILVGGTCMSV